MAKMEWVPLQKPVSFHIEEEEFASGGFRKAYKAKSDSLGFECITWVVKRYLPSALEDIISRGPESRSKCIVLLVISLFN